MIYLLLSILSSSLIYVMFKIIDQKKINTLYAIVVNYFTALTAGSLLLEREFSTQDLLGQSWLWGAIFLGVMFIVVFRLMAETTKRSGLSVVSVASKMSVAIPVTFVIIYYKEDLGILKILGILLALVAVYLASIKTKKGIQIEWKNLLFPLAVFLGSGVIETLIKFLEQNYVAKTDVALFSMTLFICAAGVGTVAGFIQYQRKKIKFTYKELVGGILLGIPNYFSIHFFVLALRSYTNDSVVFVINNVAIVVLSTMLGIAFFNEKLLRKNWIGIGLAAVSIILVAYTTR